MHGHMNVKQKCINNVASKTRTEDAASGDRTIGDEKY